MKFLRELGLDLLALVWPCACAVCAAPDRELCEVCRAELLTDRRSRGAMRAHWLHLPDDLAVYVTGPYEGALRELMIAYKHAGRIGFARVLGASLRAPLRAALRASHAASAPASPHEQLCEPSHKPVREPLRASRAPPFIVTVASRRSRVRERGYRHVDLLVRRALRGEGPGDPLRNAVFVPGALQAKRGRTGQVGLSAAERELNAARIEVPARMRATLRGRHVVLVDDIITTGATVRGAVAALAAAEANVIAVVAVCATERRDRLAKFGVETDPHLAIGFEKGVKVRSTMWPPA